MCGDSGALAQQTLREKALAAQRVVRETVAIGGTRGVKGVTVRRPSL